MGQFTQNEHLVIIKLETHVWVSFSYWAQKDMLNKYNWLVATDFHIMNKIIKILWKSMAEIIVYLRGHFHISFPSFSHNFLGSFHSPIY